MSTSAWRTASRILRGCLLLAAMASPAWAQPAMGASRQDVKAAFLFNFIKFTEWPDGALGSDGAPLVIGVVGAPELAGDLRTLLAGKRVMQRPIVVRGFDDAADPTGCHVLFVGSRTTGEIEAMLSRVRGLPVLTVGDGRKFVTAGGILAFEEQGETLKFSASIEAAALARLTLSSQLLRVAIQRPQH